MKIKEKAVTIFNEKTNILCRIFLLITSNRFEGFKVAKK